MARKAKKVTAENAAVETLATEIVMDMPIIKSVADVAETSNISDELEAVITEEDAGDKHVALRQLAIVKEYIDEKVKNAGSGSSGEGTLTDDHFATEQEVRDIFEMNV